MIARAFLKKGGHEVSEKEKNENTESKGEDSNAVWDLAKQDPELKEFFRDSEHFTDLFNGVCFGGKQILHPEDLQEMDTDVSGVLVAKEYRTSLVRSRDVLKRAVNGTQFVLLGVENQNVVDYTMPLRTMIYDGMNYLKEIKEMKSKNKGGMKVTPVITVVIYYGKKAWDGPISLKGMMRELPDYLQELISDYKMNLVEVLHGTYIFHNEDVKMLFEYSQAITKKDRSRIEELDSKYQLKEDVLCAIGKFVDISEAKQKIGKEKKEEISMCELFDDIREEGREEGDAVIIGLS